MKSLLVGVIGHVDHGKTALVRALTGVETDRLKEEQARGVSIVPGFALLKCPGGEIDLVDLPGHERFVRAMISGATGMRTVLLAVDANEGIKPQTIEHLEIAALIGVRRGVAALTKCDLVGPEVVAARTAEIAAVLARAGIEAAQVVPTSAFAGTGIAALADALGRVLEEAAEPADDGFPYLPFDRVFTRPGFGAVVTGTLRRGPLRVGDAVRIMPGAIDATVRSLQIHGRPVEVALPGRRTAVALRGVERAQLERGQALAVAGLLAPTRWIDVAVTAAASAEAPLTAATPVRLLFGTTEAAARLRLLDRDALEPGASGLAQLRTEAEIALPAREPFILRLESPAATVAGGRVLDPASRRRKRHDPRVLADLAALAAGRPSETLAIRLERAGPAGETLAELACAVGVAPERVRRRLAETGAREAGERWLGPRAFAAIRDDVLAALAQHHRDHPVEHGIALARLLPLLRTGTGEAAAQAALRDLAASGAVVQAGTLFRQAGFDPARNETEVVRRLEAAFRQAGLSPPDEAEVIGRDLRRREALTYLLGAGTIVRTVDRVQKRSILFHRDAIAQARARLAAGFTDSDGFLAREAGALLGISRKFSIPLLEHLDAVRFTRRIGDKRVIVAEPGPAGHGT